MLTSVLAPSLKIRATIFKCLKIKQSFDHESFLNNSKFYTFEEISYLFCLIQLCREP